MEYVFQVYYNKLNRLKWFIIVKYKNVFFLLTPNILIYIWVSVNNTISMCSLVFSSFFNIIVILKAILCNETRLNIYIYI
jgi:hypothetical protein